MRPFYLLTALLPLIGALAATQPAAAQETPAVRDTVYYSHDWDSTNREHAYYMNVRTKTADGWRVVSQTLAGIPYHAFTLVHDTMTGPDTLYYDNGKIKAAGNDWKWKSDGDWTAWFPSGKVMASAKFNHGDQLSAAFFHEDGSPDDSKKIFMSESQFPGGDAGWLAYLQQNLRYPKSAIRHEVEGKVMIQFIVSEKGEPTNFTIAQSSGNEALDKEALRVLRGSGNWTPATQFGINVKSYKRQPIIFRLQ